MRSNSEVLRSEQYADSSNLNARIALHARFTTNSYEWFRWVFDHFNDLPQDAHILELGSGSCRLWAENLARIPKGWDITLSDFSPGMLADGQKTLGDAAARFRFEIIDAQSIPHPNASFDAVIANHMLYHVPDRPKAFAGIQRVLKPGGFFFAATNGENNMQEIFTLGRKVHPMLVDAGRKLINLAHFTLENGRGQLAPWFEQIAVERYEDALEVTEAEPIVDYIMSMAVMEKIPIGQDVLRAGLRKLAAAEIEQHGMVRIEKATGLFIAGNRSN